MDEGKERQKEVKEKLEDAGLDPDEFDDGPPPHKTSAVAASFAKVALATKVEEAMADKPDGHSEQINSSNSR